ncbi:MAG: transposase [Planctomycetaceae bacterium]|nr:transposase [Planctomycetaceae bacterium]
MEASRGKPRPDGTSTRDTDASFTSKDGVPHHGYKGHIGFDLSGIVTKLGFGTAAEHDSRHIDRLTADERTLVLADSAYSSQERRDALRARGVIVGIMSKRNCNQAAFYDWQVRWNSIVARHRARVEHPTAMLKQQLGYRRVRHRGGARNAFDLALTVDRLQPQAKPEPEAQGGLNGPRRRSRVSEGAHGPCQDTQPEEALFRCRG